MNRATKEQQQLLWRIKYQPVFPISLVTLLMIVLTSQVDKWKPIVLTECSATIGTSKLH